MYLWDSNILRHYGEGHAVLRQHLSRIARSEIALPSVVVAEVLRGRNEFALKASLEQAPMAHRQFVATLELLRHFSVVAFDESAAQAMLRLVATCRTRKRRAYVMIAAIALAGHHVVVTRNQSDFIDLLPRQQLQNWIDVLPG
jgi:predicted nucleic acid-binding protein